jgi:hypothetical protein
MILNGWAVMKVWLLGNAVSEALPCGVLVLSAQILGSLGYIG